MYQPPQELLHQSFNYDCPRLASTNEERLTPPPGGRGGPGGGVMVLLLNYGRLKGSPREITHQGKSG